MLNAPIETSASHDRRSSYIPQTGGILLRSRCACVIQRSVAYGYRQYHLGPGATALIDELKYVRYPNVVFTY